MSSQLQGMKQFAPFSRRRKPFRSLRIVGDMLGSGLVTSLARPDGNTTGVSILARELTANDRTS